MREILMYADADQGKRKARRIVNAFIEEGIINPKDGVTVALKPNDPDLQTHGKMARVEVVTIFRDGPKGPIDATTDTYTVRV